LQNVRLLGEVAFSSIMNYTFQLDIIFTNRILIVGILKYDFDDIPNSFGARKWQGAKR
jgi:hypothetical protein